MKRRKSTRSDPARELLAEILGAKDRDCSPGARELVAYREGDDPQYLGLLREEARVIEQVSRFGRPLLAVAELPARRVPRVGREEVWQRRWRSARPIVLPGWAASLVERESSSIADMSRVLASLRKPRTLARFLKSKGIAGESVSAAEFDDPTRDLEKFHVGDRYLLPRAWIKSATLTSPETNRSGRIRFSFGAEGDDDASADRKAHGRVAALARECMPFADALARSRSRMGQLERFIGGPPLLTQHIAYWNAPEGGALLHHDSFHEPARTRQRGVCYVQLSGATIWLALSTADLVRHVAEFVEALESGAAPWIVDEHFGGRARPGDRSNLGGRASLGDRANLGGRASFAQLARRARERAWLAAELTSPGSGRFASLLNYSAEFLAILIDAGHAWRLEAGDAILLPNHGHKRTALHAVWCAGQQPGAALSMAIRR